MECVSLSYAAYALANLFILLQLTTYINIGSCLAGRPILFQTNTEYIKQSCNATLYPQMCYNSLSSYANKIQTSPKILTQTALSVTLSAARSTSVLMKNLSKSEGLKPREAAAILDCVEELSDSVDELQQSIKEMSHIGGSNFENQINDIQTWVSAALTDDDTCLDGFAGNTMNGQVKTIVRRHTLKVAHLTSIALAFINNYAAG